jgi:hypothetical protein
MNIAPEPAQLEPRKRLPRWQRVVRGALIGAVLGFFGTKLGQSLVPDSASIPDLTGLQVAALALGAMALPVGLICLAMSYSRRFYESENWTPESGPDEHRVIAPQLRLSAVAMLAMAVEFFALGLPVDPDRAPLVIGVVAISLAVQLWVNWRVWQAGDELYRAVVLEGSAISLGLVLILLTLWAPLAIYGLVAFDPLAVIMAVTVACIVPTIWLTVKRGMTE